MTSGIWDVACIVPSCVEGRQPGSLFCRPHEQAPPAQRGGWLSAERRRRKMGMDASNITTRLWVGGKPPLDRDLPNFDMIVLCAQEIQPTAMAFHGAVVRCPIPDSSLTAQEISRVVSAARRVCDAIAGGRRVLVTCQMGINRSVLVASVALAFLTRSSADDIVALMRSRRHPQVLSNPYFLHVLRCIAGAGRAPRR